MSITIKIEKKYLLYLILGLFLLTMINVFAFTDTASRVGMELREIGCNAGFATNCDANFNGVINNAEISTNALITNNLGGLPHTFYCKSSGANCLLPTTTISCRVDTSNCIGLSEAQIQNPGCPTSHPSLNRVIGLCSMGSCPGNTLTRTCCAFVCS